METPPSQSTDSRSPAGDQGQLLKRLRAGDQAAYEQVVRTYGPRLLSVARRFLRHEQDAQDAVQDAFLSAFKSIHRFQGESQLGTWLHRIVVNASLMKLRSRQRHPERSIDDLLPRFDDDGHISEAGCDLAVSVDSAVRDREVRELVRKRMDELPDSYRAVLLLRDIEGQSTDETASLLGISAGAVKTRLHRARLALRSLLDSHMREAS